MFTGESSYAETQHLWQNVWDELVTSELPIVIGIYILLCVIIHFLMHVVPYVCMYMRISKQCIQMPSCMHIACIHACAFKYVYACTY